MTDAQYLAWLQSASAIRCTLVEVAARIAGVETTLYLSSLPYTTGSGDTPAHTGYLPCVNGGVSFREALSLAGGAAGSSDGGISNGDIEISNADGSRDAWLGYVWANRVVRVYMGDVTWPRADFRLLFDGVVGDLDTRNADVLNLTLLDKLQRLNQPVTASVLGGSTVNKDKLLPVVLGELFNTEPLLVDAANLEYQVHDGAIEDVIEVRDNGAPRTITKTVGTGKFRLTAARVGQITASVQGDKPGGVYGNTIAALVQRLATGYGPAGSRFSGGDLDAAQLATFAAANTQPVGIAMQDRVNVLLACQQLAASVGAQVVMTGQGLLRVVQIALPAVGTPIAIGPADYELGSLRLADRLAVRAAVKLAYCRNWTPQSNGMATGLPDSTLENLRAEWLYVTASDGTVAATYKLGTEPPVEETLLVRQADAQAEADRRLALWKTPRHLYTVRCYSHLLLTDLGAAVTLRGNRYGLQAGATGQVVSLQRDWMAGRIDITVLI